MGRPPRSGDEPDWAQAEIIEAGAPGGGPAAPGGAEPGVPGPGARRGPAAGARRSPVRPRWAIGLLGAAALIVVGTAVVRHARQPPDAQTATESSASPPSATGSAAATVTTSGADGSIGLPAQFAPITESDSPLLPEIDALLTVYGFAPGDGNHPPTVMRLDPVTGREVDTRLPALDSTGPVSMLEDEAGVIIRPLDAVPGYRVPDGSGAQPLTGLLARSGPALPGPRPGTVWVPDGAGTQYDGGQSDGGQSDGAGTGGMTLVDEAGRALGPHVSLSQGDPGAILADGAGGVMTVGADGSIEDLDQDRLYTTVFGTDGQTVTGTAQGSMVIGTGQLIATGPTGYAYLPCVASQSCQLSYVGRGGNLVQTMNIPAGMGQVLYGALSPDGSHLAVAVSSPSTGSPAPPGATSQPDDPSTAPVLAIFDLRDVTSWLGSWIPLNPDAGAGALAWTPDSRWLLAATGDNQLMAVAAGTHEVRTISVWAGVLDTLLVRAGS